MVSFGNLRILLHKTLWCCLFLSESNIFENSCVNLFQFDFISIGNTENHFWAAPSKVVILRHLAFVKNLKVDFLLFRVVEGNMGVVFHFAFELVDTSV